jgi:small subunit ribosomal protein S8
MNTNLIKFLIKLKNASLSQKETLTVDCNSLNLELLKILYVEGLIQSFRVKKQNTTQKKSSFVVKVTLRYFYNKPLLKNLKIFSKPSHLKYIKYSDICKIGDKRFIFFLSTSQGILTSLECKKKRTGGKLLFMC